MVEEQHGYGYAWAPIGAPLNMHREDQNGTDFDSSINAVSFGFVATAILISMFLVMAIFERFLRPTSPELSPSGRRTHRDLEGPLAFNAKLSHPSPKMTTYASGVSVLMPGDNIPTFIAHPVPVPCPPDRVSWPQHQHTALPSLPSNSSTSNSNSISQVQN